MCCQPSMRKLGRKRSSEISGRISVIWLQRMRRKGKERCRKKIASQRKRTSSFKAGADRRVLFVVM
nr:splicing factor 3B subunit 2-like isoform X1 [Ipomoea batatas]